MKVWISKYALSTGLEQIEVEPAIDPDFVCTKWTYFRVGRDAHENSEAAVKAAEQMRVKKIASLKKQIAKLEAMKFE